MFFDMDMLLSFRITIKFVFSSAALFNASNAIPPVSAPSPITDMILFVPPERSLALTYPSPAEIDVEL